MTTSSRNRYFVIVSLLLLIIGLTAGTVAYYVGLPTGVFSRAAGPAELKYLPRDAAVVAYADIQGVMRSEVRQKLHRLLPAENGQREFQAETGIDIEHDIDRVVACLEPHSGGETTGLVLARGRFDAGKIEALIRQHGGEVEEFAGKRLFVTGPQPGRGTAGRQGALGKPGVPEGGDGFALSFVEPGLVALGNTDMIKRTLDQTPPHDSVTANAELMNFVTDLEPSDAWAVGRFDALRFDARLPESIVRQLPGITWFSVSGRVSSTLRVVIKADARDDESATNLEEVARGFVGLARFQTGRSPELRALTDSVQIARTGKTLTFSLTVPGEIFDTVGRLPK